MTAKLRLAFLLFALVAPGFAQGAGVREAKQELATLLDKIAESNGGWARVRSVTGIRLKRTVRRSDKTYQYERLVLPDRIRQEDTEFGDIRTAIVSPRVGVVFQAAHTDTNLDPKQKEAWADGFRFNHLFLMQRTSDPAYTFAVLDGEKIGGVDTKILEVKAYGRQRLLFVDVRTGRILRHVGISPDGSRLTSDFADWVTVGGIVYPLTQKVKIQNAKGETTSETEDKSTAIEFNPTVDERLFERNGAALADIPFHPAAMEPVPAAPKPLTFEEVRDALRKGLARKRVADLVREYGVDFGITAERERTLRAAGADDSVMYAISQAKK